MARTPPRKARTPAKAAKRAAAPKSRGARGDLPPDAPLEDGSFAVSSPEWLHSIIHELESSFDSEEKPKTKGAAILQALAKQAAAGNVRAFRELMKLYEAARRNRRDPPKRSTERRDIDPADVERLSRMGLTSLAEIADCLGIPPATLGGPAHREAVEAAIRRGRHQAKLDALSQYELAIAEGNNRVQALLIFKLKQFGWKDRQDEDKQEETSDGGRERLREALDRLRRKRQFEGSAPEGSAA